MINSVTTMPKESRLVSNSTWYDLPIDFFFVPVLFGISLIYLIIVIPNEQPEGIVSFWFG